MHAILTGPLAPPRLLRPEIAPALEALVVRAMSREPDRRFAGAREFGRALAPFASEPSAWLREFTKARVFEATRIDGRSSDPAPSTGTITMTSFAKEPTPRRRRLALVTCIAATLVSVATVLWHGRHVPRVEAEQPTRSEARAGATDPSEASSAPSTEPAASISVTDLVASTPSPATADRSVQSVPERTAQGPLHSSPPRKLEPRSHDTAPERGASPLYDHM
jgi:hypothetical protein